MTDITSLRKTLKNHHKRLNSWRGVGDIYGITGAMAFRISERGYEPKDPHVRHKLGLPAYVLAPVCDKCGEVHLAHRCTKHKRLPRRWDDYPIAQLRAALINRTEMEDTTNENQD